MSYYIASDRFGNYDLCHHGIKGQKWGIRRYQNEDMTWTAAGKERYGRDGGGSHKEKREFRSRAKAAKMLQRQSAKNERLAQRFEKHGKTAKAAALRQINKYNQENIEKRITGSRQSFRDAMFGGQKWMNSRTANFNTPLSRLEERQIQRGMRAALRLTSEKTLRRMTAEEGANYARSKYTYNYAFLTGRAHQHRKDTQKARQQERRNNRR